MRSRAVSSRAFTGAGRNSDLCSARWAAASDDFNSCSLWTDLGFERSDGFNQTKRYFDFLLICVIYFLAHGHVDRHRCASHKDHLGIANLECPPIDHPDTKWLERVEKV